MFGPAIIVMRLVRTSPLFSIFVFHPREPGLVSNSPTLGCLVSDSIHFLFLLMTHTQSESDIRSDPVAVKDIWQRFWPSLPGFVVAGFISRHI